MFFLVSDGFTVKQTLRGSLACRTFVRDRLLGSIPIEVKGKQQECAEGEAE